MTDGYTGDFELDGVPVFVWRGANGNKKARGKRHPKGWSTLPGWGVASGAPKTPLGSTVVRAVARVWCVPV